MSQFPRGRSRRTLSVALAGALALTLAACGGSDGEDAAAPGGGACDLAPDYPRGPVEFIVPWAAGGGTDAVARLVGNQLSDALGVQVNVVNRTGGAGVVGHQAMATANPDGQTIGLVTAEIAMMHWQGLTDLSHDDLTAISQVNADAAAVTVAADSEYETAQDLLDATESATGSLTASGTAQGGIGHLAALGMLMDADLPLDAVTWVPSDGAAPALQELVAGGVDFIVTSSVGEVASMIDAGEVRSIAVMAESTDENFPDVPLLREQTGVEYLGGTWRGIVGPSGLDENVVAELDCHMADIVETDEFKNFMSQSGYSIVYQDAAGFGAFMEEQDTVLGEVMDAAGLTG